jgi:hypothetical protein
MLFAENRIIGSFESIRKGGDMVFFEKFFYTFENIKFNETDCSHRYLTKFNKSKFYKIVDEMLIYYYY